MQKKFNEYVHDVLFVFLVDSSYELCMLRQFIGWIQSRKRISLLISIYPNKIIFSLTKKRSLLVLFKVSLIDFTDCLGFFHLSKKKKLVRLRITRYR